MKKKVLLMGASGSGKTSMRSVIFSNNPASLTTRLGATIDVEQNHVRFLGDLILNLWDCGGQDSFMESYLTSQRSTIFQQVGVLIYVFDIESQELDKDVVYYRDCLEALRKYSPNAGVFLLVHKVDLVREAVRESTLDEKKKWLREWSGVGEVTIYGTSIYDESLYKAWSRIVHTLIPNASLLAKHLTMFAEACNATEVIMFERTTFLVIATSSSPAVSSTSPTAITSANQFLEALYPSSSSTGNGSTPTKELVVSDALSTASDSTAQPDGHLMEHARYERTSEIIKFFKHSCSKWREEFFCHEMEFPDFTLVLDELTRNTYIMVVVHDPTIETAAIKMNIRLARQKFEDMQSGGS